MCVVFESMDIQVNSDTDFEQQFLSIDTNNVGKYLKTKAIHMYRMA